MLHSIFRRALSRALRVYFTLITLLTLSACGFLFLPPISGSNSSADAGVASTSDESDVYTSPWVGVIQNGGTYEYEDNAGGTHSLFSVVSGDTTDIRFYSDGAFTTEMLFDGDMTASEHSIIPGHSVIDRWKSKGITATGPYYEIIEDVNDDGVPDKRRTMNMGQPARMTTITDYKSSGTGDALTWIEIDQAIVPEVQGEFSVATTCGAPGSHLNQGDGDGEDDLCYLPDIDGGYLPASDITEIIPHNGQHGIWAVTGPEKYACNTKETSDIKNAVTKMLSATHSLTGCLSRVAPDITNDLTAYIPKRITVIDCGLDTSATAGWKACEETIAPDGGFQPSDTARISLSKTYLDTEATAQPAKLDMTILHEFIHSVGYEHADNPGWGRNCEDGNTRVEDEGLGVDRVYACGYFCGGQGLIGNNPDQFGGDSTDGTADCGPDGNNVCFLGGEHTGGTLYQTLASECARCAGYENFNGFYACGERLLFDPSLPSTFPGVNEGDGSDLSQFDWDSAKTARPQGCPTANSNELAWSLSNPPNYSLGFQSGDDRCADLNPCATVAVATPVSCDDRYFGVPYPGWSWTMDESDDLERFVDPVGFYDHEYGYRCAHSPWSDSDIINFESECQSSADTCSTNTPQQITSGPYGSGNGAWPAASLCAVQSGSDVVNLAKGIR